MRGYLILICLTSALLFADSEVLTDSEESVVQSISLVGSNAQVTFRTQVGQPYDAAIIEKDVRQLWSTGKFEDIQVERKDGEQGVAVIFHVVEVQARPLHEFRIEPSTFGLQLKVPEGTPITRLRAHQIAGQAEKELQESGFRDAQVDYKILPFSGKQVDLHLNVQAGERTRVVPLFHSAQQAAE